MEGGSEQRMKFESISFAKVIRDSPWFYGSNNVFWTTYFTGMDSLDLFNVTRSLLCGFDQFVAF